MMTFKKIFQLTLIGFCTSSVMLDLITKFEVPKVTKPVHKVSSTRGPASVSSKKAVKIVAKSKKTKAKFLSSYLKKEQKKKPGQKKRLAKESIQNWQNWNSFQINLTEVYTHNGEIFGTYKLASSKVDLAQNNKQGSIFTQNLKGQLGHMVIKHGKFYLFRPMANLENMGNLTEVESVNFPIRMYRNGRDRFLSGSLNEDDQRYFYKLKNYVPLFKQSFEQQSNQTTSLLQDNYDSHVKFSCNKNKPNTYTCTASLIFTKRYTDMVTSSTPAQNANSKPIAAEKI